MNARFIHIMRTDTKTKDGDRRIIFIIILNFRNNKK